jgi:hypothetical protein
MGLWLTWCGFKDNRKLWLRSRRRLQKWSGKIVLALRLNFEQKGLASRRQVLLSRNWLGLGMAAAHDGFVKALLDYLARGGFQYHLVAQDRRAIGLFSEVCFDAVGFLTRQQTRIRAPVRQFEALAAMEHVRQRDVPFMSQCFYSFTSHSALFY